MGPFQKKGSRNTHGTSSLIGGDEGPFSSGISLDGESLVLPPSNIGHQPEMDVESIDSQSLYAGNNYFPPDINRSNLRILSPVPATPSTNANASKADATTAGSKQVAPPPPIKTSQETPSGSPCFCCLPVWLRLSPCWIKLILLFSTLLVVGAAVMVGLGLTIGLDSFLPMDSFSSSSQQEQQRQPPIPELFLTSSPSAAASPVRSPVDEISAKPSTVPTIGPTFAPSLPPTEIAPSLSPTEIPTTIPSAVPSPAIDESLSVIYVAAGPVTDPEELALLPRYRGRGMFFHLGDWNDSGRCNENVFMDQADVFAQCSVPVFLLMGDKEFSNCASPFQARDRWLDTFDRFDSQHWTVPWRVWRDERNGFGENFSYGDDQSGTAVVGISQVTTFLDFESQQNRQVNNLLWVKENYDYYLRLGFDFLVVMTNAAPGEAASMYEELTTSIRNEYTEMEFVIVHQSLDTQGSDVRRSYDGIPNLTVVSIPGGSWPATRLGLDRQADTPEGRLDVQHGNGWWGEWVTGDIED